MIELKEGQIIILLSPFVIQKTLKGITGITTKKVSKTGSVETIKQWDWNGSSMLIEFLSRNEIFRKL